MARILMELYSKKTPENLISLLNEAFDGVFFFHFSENTPSEKEKAEFHFVLSCLQGITPSFCAIEKKDISGALEAFSRIYQSGNIYEIDITGGDEIFIAAAGIFQSKAPENSVFLHKYHVRSGKKLFRYPVKAPAEKPFPCHLSVPQFLSLGGNPPLEAPFYSFAHKSVEEEVLRLWNAVKRNLKEWNRFCSLSSDPRDEVFRINEKLLDSEKSRRTYFTIAEKLKKANIITNQRFTKIGGKELATFTLNVPKEMEVLYHKAGNLLELYGALAAYHAGCFHDIRVGVILDWDGTIASSDAPDPRNEVDLFLMRDNLPYLVSCKNTVPENEHLYEIMIMAKHYGGFFATPMLLASGRASETVKKRAAEMGIVLIDDAEHLSLPALSKKLCALEK